MHTPKELEFDLVDRLQKAMRVSGHTAGTLAGALGVHRNTIGNYLAGRTHVDRRTLLAWAMACSVPIEWLETGHAPGPTPDPTGEPVTNTALAQLTAAKRARVQTNLRYFAKVA